jgi:hypothetical protein
MAQRLGPDDGPLRSGGDGSDAAPFGMPGPAWGASVWDDARMAHRAAPVTSGPRFEGVRGWELVDAGMTDLAAGRLTIESELVRSGSDRLRGLSARRLPSSLAGWVGSAQPPLPAASSMP